MWALDARASLITSTDRGANYRPHVRGDSERQISEEQVKLDTEWKKECKEWKTGEGCSETADCQFDSLTHYFEDSIQRVGFQNLESPSKNHFQKRVPNGCDRSS